MVWVTTTNVNVFPSNCLCQYRWVGLAMTVQWWASAVARRSPRPRPPAHHPVSQLLQQWPYQLFLQLSTGLIRSLPHIFSVPTVPTANLKSLTFLTLSLLNMLQNKSGWDGLTDFYIKYPNFKVWYHYKRGHMIHLICINDAVLLLFVFSFVAAKTVVQFVMFILTLEWNYILVSLPSCLLKTRAAVLLLKCDS